MKLVRVFSLGWLVIQSIALLTWTVSAAVLLYAELFPNRAEAQVIVSDPADERDRGKFEARVERLEDQMKALDQMKIETVLALMARDIDSLRKSVQALERHEEAYKTDRAANQKYVLTTLAGVLLIALRSIYILASTLYKHGQALLARKTGKVNDG